MNICFFDLPEESGVATTGGIERAAHLLAKELRRRGHHVDFYSSGSWRRPKIPLLSVVFSGFLSTFLPSLSNRSERIRFWQFLRDHKIDVAVQHKKWRVQLTKNMPCRAIAVLHFNPCQNSSARAFNATLRMFGIRSQFGQKIFRLAPLRFLLRKFYDVRGSRGNLHTMRYCDKFVLLSERYIPEFATAKKFPQKACAIPNIATYGVQNVPFGEKKKELLWLGRMDLDVKTPDLVLRIWSKLQDRFPDWKLRFVGDGPHLLKTKDLAASLCLKNVYFEGFQDPTPYYRSAPIFCMTSTSEGFPMVLLEAQAFGCVPIAFESFGSVRDIIDDGVNGVLVPPFDLDIYAEKLAQLMSDPELRERLALNAQKGVAKFSAEAIGDKWEKLLKEVVGR